MTEDELVAFARMAGEWTRLPGYTLENRDCWFIHPDNVSEFVERISRDFSDVRGMLRGLVTLGVTPGVAWVDGLWFAAIPAPKDDGYWPFTRDEHLACELLREMSAEMMTVTWQFAGFSRMGFCSPTEYIEHLRTEAEAAGDNFDANFWGEALR